MPECILGDIFQPLIQMFRPKSPVSGCEGTQLLAEAASSSDASSAEGKSESLGEGVNSGVKRKRESTKSARHSKKDRRKHKKSRLFQSLAGSAVYDHDN